MEQNSSLSERKSWIPACCLLSLFLFSAFAAYIAWALHETFAPSHPDLKKISEYTSIRFPVSAKLIGSTLYKGHESLLYAAVRIDNSDVRRLIEHLKSDLKLKSGGNFI
jgi:hypothetical protein